MVDLSIGIEDELSFLRVELDTEEGIVLALHSSNEGSALVIIAYSDWGEDL